MQQETVKDEPGEEDDDDDGQDDDSLATVQFEPIDSRHLSSLPLIRARITKLLKNSPNGIQPATNLLPKLVCPYSMNANRNIHLDHRASSSQ